MHIPLGLAEESRNFRQDFGFSEDDILILQPTRIVARKRIEQAIYLVKWLNIPNVKLLYEGSGNAFLEAAYFKKPILVNRYTVYTVDIETKGFDVIEMDGFLTDKTVDHVKHILTDEQARNNMVDTNFNIAKQFFSFAVLRKRLASLLDDLVGGNGE